MSTDDRLTSELFAQEQHERGMSSTQTDERLGIMESVGADIRGTAAKLLARAGSRDDDDARFMVRMALACDFHARDLGYYRPTDAAPLKVAINALRFYAHDDNWLVVDPDDNPVNSAISEDGGDIAKEALARLVAPQTPASEQLEKARQLLLQSHGSSRLIITTASSVPALTPEEWAARHYERDVLSIEPWTETTGHPEKLSIYLLDQGRSMCDFHDECESCERGPFEDAAFELTPEDRHATAALLLDGQPFGFTWDDVDSLRGVACCPSHMDHCGDLADRIAALLPPRETEHGR